MNGGDSGGDGDERRCSSLRLGRAVHGSNVPVGRKYRDYLDIDLEKVAEGRCKESSSGSEAECRKG